MQPCSLRHLTLEPRSVTWAVQYNTTMLGRPRADALVDSLKRALLSVVPANVPDWLTPYITHCADVMEPLMSHGAGENASVRYNQIGWF